MVIEEIESYAKVHQVPIMEKEGISFLTNYIKEHEEIKHILEIGCAIGYSAIQMALVRDDIRITTIERDEVRYLEAIKNIQAFHLEDRITVLFQDAFDVTLNDTYDLIFIDAAKSQYVKFFEKFTPLLTKHGVVISDNLNFHGLTFTTEKIASRNVRQMVRKIRTYIDYLKSLETYHTDFYEVGDGIGVTRKK